MIHEKIVNVKICRNNYKYYESKGYTIKKELDNKKRQRVPTQYIYVNWEDIPHKSTQNIKLKCDICGKIFERTVLNYYDSHKHNDIDACSKKCQAIKSLQTKKKLYGTTNTAEISRIFGSTCGRSLKYTVNDILEAANKKDYKIIEMPEPPKVNERVKLLCNKHDVVFEISIECLMKSTTTNCPKCLSEKSSRIHSKSTIEDAQKICLERGYTLLTHYISSCDDKIEYICNKHKDYGIQTTSLYGLQHATNNCRMCRMPRGERHSNWKGGISLERDKIKNTPEYKQWVQSVFKRDNYTCQCCGKTNCSLEAHHIYNFATHKELRTDLNNGITLCHDCHSVAVKGSFHNLYTQFNNTPEQLYEYIKMKKQNKVKP